MEHVQENKIEPAQQVLLGDCTTLLRGMPDGSVDCVLTDPPYLVRYCDRSGRTVRNDDRDDWLDMAFAELYRVLKDDRFCICFYSWTKVDRFMHAWRSAGFRPVGHLVFVKPYASNQRYTAYHHEQAYVLAKGNPDVPSAPPADVLQWQHTGNRLHPTQKPISALLPLIAAFTKPGDLVLDPFAGSGSTLVAAHLLQRRGFGIELDPEHHKTATRRLERLRVGTAPCGRPFHPIAPFQRLGWQTRSRPGKLFSGTWEPTAMFH